MDVNDPRFEAYQSRFEEIAQRVEGLKGPQPDISAARIRLCLYGENLMSPQEEFETLEMLCAKVESGLKKATIQTGYWEDVILYLP